MTGPPDQPGIMKYPAFLLITSLALSLALPARWAAADSGTAEKAQAIIGLIEKNGAANSLVRDLARLGPDALETIRSGIKKGPQPVSAALVKARNLIISIPVSYTDLTLPTKA